VTQHVLKTDPMIWDAIASGEKRFELRRDDRNYQTGDLVVLYRGTHSTIPQLHFRVGYILRDAVEWGLRAGFVTFQLEKVDG